MEQKLQVYYEGTPCYNIDIQSSFLDFSQDIKEISDTSYQKVCVVTDSNVEKLYLDEIIGECDSLFSSVFSFTFEAGEASKNMDTVQKLYEFLILNHFDRKALLIALGGGVVGDLTGFVAATYLRGIDFIQVPTTLLSQVDSSIGGKTGVDFMQYKNMVGAFYMPRLVYINIRTLHTLPEVQFQSGMGEVIKHGLIQNDSYFQWLKEQQSAICALDDSCLEKMVYESCKIKKRVVEEDPKETSIRGYLNFGHSIGHAIEKLSDFRLFHGQCVAIGIHAALILSHRLGYLTQEEIQEALALLTAYGLPVSVSGLEPKKILAAMKSDKKMVGSKIKFIILQAMGEAAIYRDFTDEDLMDAIGSIICQKKEES